MSVPEYSSLNLQFIFPSDASEIYEKVCTALADRKLVGLIRQPAQRENCTEVVAEVITIDDSRDPVLYRVDAKGKLREGARATRLLHDLKKTTEATHILIDGHSLDSTTPDAEDLGVYRDESVLTLGPKLRGTDLIMANATGEHGALTAWNLESGLMARSDSPFFLADIAASSSPILCLHRKGRSVELSIAQWSTQAQWPATVYFELHLDCVPIIDIEHGGPARQLFEEFVAGQSGWEDLDERNLSEIVANPVTRSEIGSLLKAPATEETLHRLVKLLGFDPRSVDFLLDGSTPEGARTLDAGTPLKAVKSVIEEQQYELRGAARFLQGRSHSPKALFGLAALTWTVTVLFHLGRRRSEKLSRMPKALTTILLIDGYLEGSIHFARALQIHRRQRRLVA